MKKFYVFFAWLILMVPSTAKASVLNGDVDCDGAVNINDVTTLIDLLLSGNTTNTAGDVDGNGMVNIDDLVEVIDMLLNGGGGGANPQDDDEWVDLGLPSGTFWAKRNIGASAPEDYGEFFAWGEIETKEYYDFYWWDYKWCRGSNRTLTKYCINSDYGIVDNKAELDSDDDVAYVRYESTTQVDPNWWIRMPTLEEQQEIIEHCDWTWTSRNGVYGMLLTGPNNNTIFLPAAGYHWFDEAFVGAGSYGYYWSRTLYSVNYFSDQSYKACFLRFSSSSAFWYYYNRYTGFPIRAVRVPLN